MPLLIHGQADWPNSYKVKPGRYRATDKHGRSMEFTVFLAVVGLRVSLPKRPGETFLWQDVLATTLQRYEEFSLERIEDK